MTFWPSHFSRMSFACASARESGSCGLSRRWPQNRQLRETQAALVQSEKLASLGQLAAGMAHEINNPIAYVINNFAVLKRNIRAVMDLLDAYERGRETWSATNAALAEQIAALEQACDLPWIREHLPQLFDASLQGLSRVREVVKNLRKFAARRGRVRRTGFECGRSIHARNAQAGNAAKTTPD